MIHKVRASDRMSRSEIALPLPFPPTELQVMICELAKGHCETKNLILLGGGCKWARWAAREAAGVWDIQVVVLQCRSWFHLQWVWWLQPPSFHRGRPRNFWSLPARPCRAKWEARLVSCHNGMDI